MSTEHEITAFNNIGASAAPWAEVPGTETNPTELSVGDLVWGYGHGRARLGVVVSVGRKNAVAIYTTPGALDEQRRIAEKVRATTPESVKNSAEQMARRTYAYYESMVDGTCELFTRFSYSPERIADERAQAEVRLAEFGSVERYVTVQRALAAHRLEEAQANHSRPLVERVLFTKMTLKPGRCKLVQSA